MVSQACGNSFAVRLLRRAAVVAAALVFILALPLSSTAEERIISFLSESWVEADGALVVRETIEVEAEGIDIRRGIYRDFPTDYKDRHGFNVRVAFDVENVLRNGQPEGFFTEDRANGVRLYIGKSDVFITHGRHTYEITYRTDRQLGFFEEFDELYWNVTGDGWAFNIETARARIHLPAGAEFIEAVGFTGSRGSTGTDYTQGQHAADDVWFETTRVLLPGEGFTVAVSWPKGFVSEPTLVDDIGYFIVDNLAAAAAITGVLALLIYYLVIWWKVGRDPEGGTIFPRYEPPPGVSAAASRYISEMGFDNEAFTAAVVSAAVKGALTIEQDSDNVYTLAKRGEPQGLSNGERKLVRKLFTPSKQSIEVKQKNHKRLRAAKTALEGALDDEFEKTHFVHNTGYFVIGALISLAAVAALLLSSQLTVEAGFMAVWIAVWSVGTSLIIRRAWHSWRTALREGGFKNYAAAVPATFIAVIFSTGWVVGAGFFIAFANVFSVVFIVAIALVNVVFFELLKAPTMLGRRVLDEIEGFRMFLSVAEKDRMNMLNPPDRTPELFERFLPYALALGVEQQWSEQFASVFAAIGPEAQAGTYHPHWYSGRSFGGDLGGMSSSLSSGMTGAISSSSVAPGSSSGTSGGGFSGGGSSGGGGGGGGGGGW